MADELIPPAIRNGGAGPAPTTGRADPGSFFQTGEVNASGVDRAADVAGDAGAARARALGGLFKEFEGISSDIGTKATTQAGALAGAASGNTGHPQYKEGLARFTAYGQAFNNAATGAYAIEAEAQADDAAARLRVEANNNPATFAATYAAARDAVLKQAPALAVPMLTELYNKRLAAGLAAISGDQATEQKQLQAKVWEAGVQRQASRVATLMGSPDTQDQLAASDEQVKLGLMIDGGVKSGLYSEAYAQALHINSARDITKQVFTTHVDRALAEPDINQSNADVVRIMEKFRQDHLANLNSPNEPAILSENEFQQLMQTTTTRLREQRMLDMYTKSQAKTAEQLRYEEGDRVFTNLYLTHQLTASGLAAAVRTDNIRPERATALYNAMANGPVLRSDPKAYMEASRDPRFLDMKPEEIAALPNISNADKIKLGQEQQRRIASWEGTQAVKDAKYAISTKLKVPPGSLLVSDDQKKAVQNATLDFITRMSALDPSQRDSAAPRVAEEVIKAEHQREAAHALQQVEGFKQSFLRDHGPGSAQPWDAAKLEKKLKDYDTQIAGYAAQAKGQ